MKVSDIIVHVDADDTTGSGGRRCAYAIELANRLGAHLTGVVLALEPMIPPMVMGELPASVLDSQRERIMEQAQAAAAAFEKTADAAGIHFESMIVSAFESSAADTLAIALRTADLAILGQEEEGDGFPARNLLIETALFDSGRPIIVVPYVGETDAKLDNVVVAWDGSREAARAVHDALPFLQEAASIDVLIVDVGQMRGEDQPGADLARHLARHGLEVNLKTIPSGGIDVANALLSYVADLRPDLVIMGGYGHSRLREFLVGGATRGMLKSMTAPVLMAH